jgi:hypothetical protein
LEAGERLLFYARPQFTPYAGHDVYWLTWGGANGQRMSQRTGDPGGLPPGVAWATALAEENAVYDSLHPDHNGERWFWRRLKHPDQVSDTLDITLETPVTQTLEAQLSVWLYGLTDDLPAPDHHVRISVQGQVVGQTQWEGQNAHNAILGLPSELLQAGNNSINLSLPSETVLSGESAWVDAISITYGLQAVSQNVARFRGQSSPSAYTIGGFSSDDLHIYDVTFPTTPSLVTGASVRDGNVNVGDDEQHTPAEYLVLTDDQIQTPSSINAALSLDDPPGGADYVIITHPDFAAALTPLAEHRAAQGLRVHTVNVQAIYDQFGDGRMDPGAIHAFLQHAYANWLAPALQYVLLVGDGTSDPRGYHTSLPTFLPPYMADVDPRLGLVPADHHYADLTGDLRPELRLGRLPVNTPDEAQAIVTKIISYENSPLPGDWNKRLLFGADDPSPQGDHPADADSEFNTFTGYGYQGERVYLSQTGGAPHLYTDAQQAQDALVAALDQGVLLYSYFGHASWEQQAALESDGYAPLFHQDHIARLQNQRRWPVVLQMTCRTSHFALQDSATLDESLLRAAGVGAIAVWGASGDGVATGHLQLHHAFYQAVLDDGQTELGAAIHAALAALYATGNNYDLIQTYHLLGDPALSLNTSDSFSVYLPFTERLP